jgi:catechol-2,3-dioxygenase
MIVADCVAELRHVVSTRAQSHSQPWSVTMRYTKSAFSGFSVNDLAKAKTFYAEILGLEG